MCRTKEYGLIPRLAEICLSIYFFGFMVQMQLTDASTMIQVEDISKFLAKNHVVGSLSFSVLTGETLGLLGPNGIGKILTCLVRPTDETTGSAATHPQKSNRTHKALRHLSPGGQPSSSSEHRRGDLSFCARLRGLSRSSGSSMFGRWRSSPP